LGSPVDLSVATQEFRSPEVEIWQSGGVNDSYVFELEDGRIACILDAGVCTHTSKPIYIEDVELRMPWKSTFQWLTPHKVTSRNRRGAATSSYEEYRFPGRNGPELDSKDVINHVLIERKILPARRPICGWLLAIGDLMPRHLFRGGWIDAVLVITTSDHTEFCEPIHLWIERSERRRRSAPRTLDLFGNRIDGQVLESTLQARPSKSAVSKLGGGQQQASD
jgi:hypothetical protein